MQTLNESKKTRICSWCSTVGQLSMEETIYHNRFILSAIVRHSGRRSYLILWLAYDQNLSNLNHVEMLINRYKFWLLIYAMPVVTSLMHCCSLFFPGSLSESVQPSSTSLQSSFSLKSSLNISQLSIIFFLLWIPLTLTT